MKTRTNVKAGNVAMGAEIRSELKPSELNGLNKAISARVLRLFR